MIWKILIMRCDKAKTEEIHTYCPRIARRHPRIPRVYTYKEFQKCKKGSTVSKKNLDLIKLGAHCRLG